MFNPVSSRVSLFKKESVCPTGKVRGDSFEVEVDAGEEWNLWLAKARNVEVIIDMVYCKVGGRNGRYKLKGSHLEQRLL